MRFHTGVRPQDRSREELIREDSERDNSKNYLKRFSKERELLANWEGWETIHELRSRIRLASVRVTSWIAPVLA